MQTFTAVIHEEEDLYVAECPEVGTVSQGESIEAAINNLKEATELYLDEFSLKEEREISEKVQLKVGLCEIRLDISEFYKISPNIKSIGELKYGWVYSS
jgi:predicted RNase H-like HicB family nuclease